MIGFKKVKDPLMQSFVARVFDKSISYYAFLALGMVRKKVLTDPRVIEITDLGAGSKVLKHNNRCVKHIAKKSMKKEKFAQLLFRIVDWQQPKRILELGTSLGVTTGYLAKARKNAQVITIEGCPEISKIAKENFKTLDLKNVRLINDSFDVVLPKLIVQNPNFDLIFIDGNHQKDPTIKYYELLEPYINEKTIMVFDDIHWSLGMQEAWHEIIKKPQVVATIDTFEMGIVFFDPKMEKKNYSILY